MLTDYIGYSGHYFFKIKMTLESAAETTPPMCFFLKSDLFPIYEIYNHV